MAGLRVCSVLVTGANRGIGLGLVRHFLGMQNPPKWVFATCRDPKGQRAQVRLGWVAVGCAGGGAGCQGGRAEPGGGLQRAWAAAGHLQHRAAGLGQWWDQLCMGCAEGTVACSKCGRHGAPSVGSRTAGAGCWVQGQSWSDTGFVWERLSLSAAPPASPYPHGALSLRTYRMWPPITPTWSSSRSVGAPRWGSLAPVPLSTWHHSPVQCRQVPWCCAHPGSPVP